VGEIGVAGGPLLRAVHAHGVDIGAVQQRLVSGRVVRLDLLDELELTQEAARRLRPRNGKGGRRRGRLRSVFLGGDGFGRRLKGQRVCAFGAQYRSS
jgi:hypothetical protein